MNKHESILILTGDGEIYPASTMAFELSQSTKTQLLKNIGALAIYRSGDVFKIRQINRKSLYGNGFFSKFLSTIVGAYTIEVQFEELDFNFDELKTKIKELLVLDLLSEDPIFDHLTDDANTISEKVLLTKNMEELFDVILIPLPEACLDML